MRSTDSFNSDPFRTSLQASLVGQRLSQATETESSPLPIESVQPGEAIDDNPSKRSDDSGWQQAALDGQLHTGFGARTGCPRHSESGLGKSAKRGKVEPDLLEFPDIFMVKFETGKKPAPPPPVPKGQTKQPETKEHGRLSPPGTTGGEQTVLPLEKSKLATPGQNGDYQTAVKLAKIDPETWKKLQARVDEKAHDLTDTLNALDVQRKTGLDICHGTFQRSIDDLKKLGKARLHIEGSGHPSVEDRKLVEEITGLDAKNRESERLQLERIHSIDERIRDLRLARAILLIASGKDENIEAGEQELTELVRSDARLQSDPRFHESILRGYVEMSMVRQASGIEPWKTKLALSSSTALISDTLRSDPDKLLTEAVEVFFNKGVTEAEPAFKRAIDGYEQHKLAADQDRLQKFMIGLDICAQIGLAHSRGEETEHLIDQRLRLLDEEKQSVYRALKFGDGKIGAELNFQMARIASGDGKECAEAVAGITAKLKDHPGFSLDDSFRNNLANAFKAFFRNGGTDGIKSGSGETSINPKYDDVNLGQLPVPAELKNESEGKPYLADQITDGALVLFGVGVVLVSAARIINRYRERRQVRETYGVKEDGTRPEVTRKENETKETKIELVGTTRTSDRVVLKHPEKANDWKSAPTAETRPVPEGFDPRKGKLGDYERVHFDSIDYYIDREGKVFRHKGDHLYPTREIELVSRQQFAVEFPQITLAPATVSDGRPGELAGTPEKPVAEGDGKTFESVRRRKAADAPQETKQSFGEQFSVESLIAGLETFRDGIPEDQRKAAYEDLMEIDRMQETIQRIKRKHDDDITKDERRLQKDFQAKVERLNQYLRGSADTLKDKLGIKHVEIELKADDYGSAGAYKMGRGVIRLRPHEIFQPHLNPASIRTIVHEGKHFEQDMLILRYYMDLETPESERGTKLSPARIDKIIDAYTVGLNADAERDIDREFLRRRIAFLEQTSGGTDPLTPAELKRAEALIDSFIHIQKITDKQRVPLKKALDVHDKRNSLREHGAKAFATDTLKTESAWHQYFGEPLPEEIEIIRQRGVKATDERTLDKFLAARAQHFTDEYFKLYDGQAHEDEASKAGDTAYRETVEILTRRGRPIPPDLARSVTQGLKMREFESDRLRKELIETLKSSEPDAIGVLDTLAKVGKDGTRNLEYIFGGKPPKELVILVDNLEKLNNDPDTDKVDRLITETVLKALGEDVSHLSRSALESVKVPPQHQASMREILNPGGSTSLNQLLLGLSSEAAEKLMKVVVEKNLTPDQARVLGETLGGGTAVYVQTLEAIKGDHVSKIAGLVVDGIITRNNAQAVHDVLAPTGGVLFGTNLDHMSADALRHTVALINETAADIVFIGQAPAHLDGEQRGHKGERFLFKGLQSVLQTEPVAGGKTLHELGWRIVPTSNKSAADRAGMDFILININDGTWLPLDVSMRDKGDKLFYQEYQIGRFFNENSGSLKSEKRGELAKWLKDYIDKKGDRAFDISHFRPPNCSEEPNPERRQTQLEEFELELTKERTRLNSERLAAPAGSERREHLEKKIKGLDSIYIEGAKNHVALEVDLRKRVVSCLTEYFKANQQHFRSSAAPPVAAQKLAPDHEGRKMVRAGTKGEITGVIYKRDGEHKIVDFSGQQVTNPTDAATDKTLTVGAMDDLIREATKGLPPDVRTDIETRLGSFKFGADGTPVGQTEQLLQEALLTAIQEGLSDGSRDHKWESILSAERSKEKAVERAATRDARPKHVLSEAQIEAYFSKVTGELFARRFGPRKDKSIADLLHTYNELKLDKWNSNALSAARTALELALDKSPELRRAIIDSFKPALEKVGLEGLESVVEQSSIKIDPTLQPGQTRLVYKDSKGVPFEAIGMDKGGKAFLRKNGASVPVESVKIEITVSPHGNASTLLRDTLASFSKATLDLTRGKRQIETGTFEMSELAARDVHAQEDLIASAREIELDKMRPFFDTTERVWRDLGIETPFPSTFDPSMAEDVHLAMDEALQRLDKSGVFDKDTIELYKDYVRKYGQEIHSASEGPVAEHFHKFFESQRIIGSVQDGLWQPSDTVPAEEIRMMEDLLRKFGPNKLANPEIQKQLIDTLVKHMKSWENLKPFADRFNSIETELSRAYDTAYRIAKMEVQKHAGKNATAEDIRAKAQAVVEGRLQLNKGAAPALETALAKMKALRTEHAGLSEKLKEVAAKRTDGLQKIVNEFCRKNGLPEVPIKESGRLGPTNATYQAGKGEITVGRSDLLTRSGGVELIADLFHEIVHNQQDMLVVRHIADQLKLDRIRTNYDLERFQQTYESLSGSKLDREYLEQVLSIRERDPDGKELDDLQTQKAIALAASFRAAQPIGAKWRQLGDSYRAVAAELRKLTGDGQNLNAEELVRKLATPGNESLSRHLFGSPDSSKWPEAIKKLVETWHTAQKNARGEAIGWNEAGARALLTEGLQGRLIAINGERHRLYTVEYRGKLHESETHLLTVGAQKQTAAEHMSALADDAKAERTAGKTVTSSEHAKLDVTPRTNRAVTDYSGKDATTEGFMLSVMFHEGKKWTRTGSLDHEWKRFETKARQVLDKGLGTDRKSKHEQLNQILREFVKQVPSLSTDPLVDSAQITFDPSLKEGGKVAFTHKNAEIRPIFRDSEHVYVRGESGEIEKIKLSEVRVQLRLSQASMEAADTSKGRPNLKATELVSSLYHQLHHLDQLQSRYDRAKQQGIDLLSTTAEPLLIEHFMASESIAAELSADFIQFRLNGNSVDGKTKLHDTSVSDFDLKRPIAEMLGERVVTSMGADGRLRIYVLNKNQSISEIDPARSEKLIKDSFTALLKALDDKISKARDDKNESLEKKLLEERAKLQTDFDSYKNGNSSFRKNLFNKLGKLAHAGRAGVGVGVTVLFLTATALEYWRKDAHESDIDLKIPMSGSPM